MEVLGRLSGGVAHDFNNMLMVLSGCTELLERALPAHSAAGARSQRRGIDTLLTDIIMPGIRGTELARQIEEMHSGVHVIYMSGFAQNLPEAQTPPGAAFLQKPFRFAALAEQLKLVPRRARAE